MEVDHSLISVMIVVIVAFLVPILLHRLKWNAIPAVVAEIMVGLILGKSGLGWVVEDTWLEMLSTLGIIFLMFLSGLEIDFNMILNTGKTSGKKENRENPLMIGLISFISILLLSFVISWILYVAGFIKDPYFITLIISTISLSVTLPVVKDKGINKKPLGQSILVTAVFADFITMILLAVYAALKSEKGFFSVLLLLLFFVIFFAVYRIIQALKPIRLTESISKETISIGTRGVFALILFFVALSETVGAENILGAFLAGVIVSLLGPREEFVSQLNAFGFGFLIPIFFVMVGAKLDLVSLMQDARALIMFPLILLAFILSKGLLVLIFRKWFSWRQSISSGILLTSTISLVIAAAAVGMDLGIINNTMNTALILAASITVIIPPIIFQQLLPDAVDEVERPSVSLVGINAATLTLAQDLHRDGYEVKVYGADKSNLEEKQRPFPIIQLPVVEEEYLQKENGFSCDIMVLFTPHDERNVELAKAAKKQGVERIIARVESKELQQSLNNLGIQLISTFFANQTLTKILIEHPTLFKLVNHDNGNLMEVKLLNHRYHLARVRDLTFWGDTLIIRILRGNEAILPHGDTVLEVGDRLIISGSPDHIHRLREMLQ
ncbi:monovalent cation:proton antiporter family protein [Thermoactinomyces sp. CICC 24226]|uniref:monovalent cation:proton antiporter family protein n=1 Tax=Thermoactinomyces sp. CICC 24226 TaxID=2767431 RepID=UPI0018DB12C2|nr:cation:proton antiporter family protein [Thermoactinomyces sp. CICC 24226]MBI0391444.1 monovalent cation:proton antiporter family protein [Thermoactinomyces sp. CICC 24226]